MEFMRREGYICTMSDFRMRNVVLRFKGEPPTKKFTETAISVS